MIKAPAVEIIKNPAITPNDRNFLVIEEDMETVILSCMHDTYQYKALKEYRKVIQKMFEANAKYIEIVSKKNIKDILDSPKTSFDKLH